MADLVRVLFRMRDAQSGQLDGDYLPVDFAANARSLGADAIDVCSIDDFKQALQDARKATKTTVIVVKADREVRVPGDDSLVGCGGCRNIHNGQRQAGAGGYEEALKKERYFL